MFVGIKLFAKNRARVAIDRSKARARAAERDHWQRRAALLAKL